MLSLDGSFACKGVMSRRGECYARHAACGNEKVLIANGEGKRQSKALFAAKVTRCMAVLNSNAIYSAV